MDFLEIIKKFLKYFGLTYIIFLVIIIGLGIIYLNNLEYITAKKIESVVKVVDTVNADQDLPMLKGSISPPIDVMKYAKSEPELIDEGKTLFSTNCVSCHGEDGTGNGIAAATLNPKPRNFHELTGWKNGPKLTQIYKTLQEGIPGSAMPSFSVLAPEDRFELIYYVQSFRNDYLPVTEAELKDLDKTYGLSAGVKQPNQIPVKLAIEKMIEEHEQQDSIMFTIANVIQKDTVSPGAAIYRIIANDLQRSVISLFSNRKWNENENDFVTLIETEPLYNGFKTNVYELTPQQVDILYQYVNKLFSNIKA